VKGGVNQVSLGLDPAILSWQKMQSLNSNLYLIPAATSGRKKVLKVVAAVDEG